MEPDDVMILGIQSKKLISKKVEPIMREWNLRPVELDILAFLWREKNIDTAKDIIKKKHISKAHISKSIENLRRGGFIHIVEDQNDHRILHLHLTEHSQEVIVRMMNVYDECKMVMQNEISQEEWETVKKVMEKINENITRELGE